MPALVKMHFARMLETSITSSQDLSEEDREYGLMGQMNPASNRATWAKRYYKTCKNKLTIDLHYKTNENAMVKYMQRYRRFCPNSASHNIMCFSLKSGGKTESDIYLLK